MTLIVLPCSFKKAKFETFTNFIYKNIHNICITIMNRQKWIKKKLSLVVRQIGILSWFFFFLISVISLSVLYNEHVEKGTTQKRKTVQEKSD